MTEQELQELFDEVTRGMKAIVQYELTLSELQIADMVQSFMDEYYK